MPSTQEPKRLNPDALPGTGMARKAGDAIRKRQNQRQAMMDELFGTSKKKKKK